MGRGQQLSDLAVTKTPTIWCPAHGKAHLVVDRDWRRHKACELCGSLICVNNWPDRRSRTPKVQGRPICSRCESARGKLRMTEHVLAEQLTRMPCTAMLKHQGAVQLLDLYEIELPDPNEPTDCGGCPPCTARRVLGKLPDFNQSLKERCVLHLG